MLGIPIHPHQGSGQTSSSWSTVKTRGQGFRRGKVNLNFCEIIVCFVDKMEGNEEYEQCCFGSSLLAWHSGEGFV